MKKKSVEMRALELAVKVVVHYDDKSDCNGRCPLSINCPVQYAGYDPAPEKKCLKYVTAEFLSLARAEAKKEKI